MDVRSTEFSTSFIQKLRSERRKKLFEDTFGTYKTLEKYHFKAMMPYVIWSTKKAHLDEKMLGGKKKHENECLKETSISIHFSICQKKAQIVRDQYRKHSFIWSFIAKTIDWSRNFLLVGSVSFVFLSLSMISFPLHYYGFWHASNCANSYLFTMKSGYIWKTRSRGLSSR